MDYMPYEEAGWKKRFEITIPILLLILVFFVLAWKLGWLAGIPLLGDMFGGGQVKDILVIGNDNNVISELAGLKADLPINYEVIGTNAAMDNIRDPSYFDKYELVILTENAYAGTPTGTVLPSIFRGYLTQYLGNGGKMIILGLAGSRDPTDNTINGWEQSGFGNYIPVSCVSIICDTASRGSTAGSNLALKVTNMNHPIMSEYETTAALTTTGATAVTYSIINVDSQGNNLAFLEDTASGRTYPAIVEQSWGVGGKTIYFAYGVAYETPRIFRNAVKYITGA